MHSLYPHYMHSLYPLCMHSLYPHYMHSLYFNYVYTIHLHSSIPLSQTLTLNLSRRARATPLPYFLASPPPDDTQCQVCQSLFDEEHMLQ